MFTKVNKHKPVFRLDKWVHFKIRGILKTVESLLICQHSFKVSEWPNSGCPEQRVLSTASMPKQTPATVDLPLIKFKVEMAPFYLITMWCAKKGASNGSHTICICICPRSVNTLYLAIVGICNIFITLDKALKSPPKIWNALQKVR